MCGIAGLIDSRLAPDERSAAVERMCAAMTHRGPDDAGVASFPDATLGMRRLAIFDPANGHQPMETPDGRLTLVFNGAIYNFRELRRELSAAGWSFRTLVRPGITGWAQVNYPYGANLDDTIRKLEYDLYYIRHFSFLLDATIVLKTIHLMLFGRGR